MNTNVNAELCGSCERKLNDSEREFREYAILKAHSKFLEGTKENEAVRHKQVYQVSF
ncbi:MAG: hypothetical protein WAK17_21210 [Candidatus Nitrosopolaris sp.]|jgi:hypothetical protein